jgi:hypothetical protein
LAVAILAIVYSDSLRVRVDIRVPVIGVLGLVAGAFLIGAFLTGIFLTVIGLATGLVIDKRLRVLAAEVGRVTVRRLLSGV